MVMGDGLLIIHLTSLREKRNLINTLYRHHRTYRWQQIDMWFLQTGMIILSTSSYSNITRALLEYSYGQCQHWGLMWLTIFPYWRSTWQDRKTHTFKDLHKCLRFLKPRAQTRHPQPSSSRHHVSLYITRQNTSTYVRIRHYTSEYVSIRQYTSSYVTRNTSPLTSLLLHVYCFQNSPFTCTLTLLLVYSTLTLLLVYS